MLTDIKNKFPLYLISLYPFALILGTLISETITFLLIFIFLYNSYLRKNWKWISNFYFKFLFLIWLYLIINFLFSNYPENSFLRAIGFIRFPILIFAIRYFLYENIKHFSIIFKVWFITLFVIIIDLYFQTIFGFNILKFTTEWQNWGYNRLSSFLGEELKIIHLLSGFVFLTIAFFIKKKHNSTYGQLMTFLIIIFSIFIIIVSNERSNTIRSVFILLLFILFLDKNLFKFKKIFLFLFFLISLTSLLLIPSLQQRYFTEINTLFINKYWKTSDSENSYSIIKNTTYGAHYLTGIAIFKENPWIGSGAKTFRLECHKEKYIDETLKFEGCSTHPHQLYIEFLSDLGSIGALIIVFFICYSLIRNLKIYFLKKHPVHLASILFIVASFLPLIPSGSFFTSFGATIFWINYSFMIFFEKITNE